MRGKRIDAGQLIAVAGITPADAGKTSGSGLHCENR